MHIPSVLLEQLEYFSFNRHEILVAHFEKERTSPKYRNSIPMICDI